MEKRPTSYEETPREIALEANQLHGKSAPPEDIGRFLLSNETDPASSQQREAAIDKRVETMSQVELMDISSKIAVEGTSLRKIYETHLIGERGLRRLVGEYLRSGDIRGSLKFELLQHEIDFERDPQLRDRIKRELKASGGSTPLSSLLQQAGVVEQNNKSESKSEAQMLKERLLKPKQPLWHSTSRRRVLDISLIVIISVLLLLVIILLVSRG